MPYGGDFSRPVLSSATEVAPTDDQAIACTIFRTIIGYLRPSLLLNDAGGAVAEDLAYAPV